MNKSIKENLVVGLILMVIFIGITIYRNTRTVEEETLKPNQVGYSFIISTNSGRYNSYLLVTPRGKFERCEGDKNLTASLHKYLDNGTYGKEVMPLDAAIDFVANNKGY